MPPTQGQPALEHPLQEQLQPNILVLTATMTQRALVLGSYSHTSSFHCPNHLPHRKLSHIWLPQPLSGPHWVSCYHCLPLHCPTSDTLCVHFVTSAEARKAWIYLWVGKGVRMEMSSLPASIFKVLRKWAPM